jgi:tetratricopeptide (TPR) repeat protein
MQAPTVQSVEGAFDGRTISASSGTARFYQNKSDFFIATPGPDRKTHGFRVAYTFGVYPLQQYLLSLSNGRLQAFQIAWDARPRAQGGQRWFDLDPTAASSNTVPFWTGRGLNWNYMCAGCHSTALRRNLDPQTLQFHTHWSDINVACEACHGPGAAHVAAATQGRSTVGTLLPLTNPSSGHWGAFDPVTGIRHWQGPKRTDAELSVCAPCHSRGRPITDTPSVSASLLDTHEPALLEPGLYHADGQIEDEDFEYGSFLQSRMHAEGVTCSDCHDPHSLKLRADGSAVCSQCHNPVHFDVEAHTHHPTGNTGSFCVACHMPAHTYMQIHVRHDHSFRIPRPDLDAINDSPDACTACHKGKSPQWAAQHIKSWFRNLPQDHHYGALLLAARDGEVSEDAVAFAAAPSSNTMLRASILAYLGGAKSAGAVNAVQAGLRYPDPLVRLGALRALSNAPPETRYDLLWPLLKDSVKDVRISAARLLAVVPQQLLPPDRAAELSKALAEWIVSQKQIADRPESAFNIAQLNADQGQMNAAESGFRASLKIDPDFAPALLNLADLYRATSRDSEAEPLLQHAVRVDPQNPDAGYALALTQIRLNQKGNAAQSLRAVLQHSPDYADAAYALALLDEASGALDEAASVLSVATAHHPTNTSLVTLSLRIAKARGNTQDIQKYIALQNQ